LFLHDTKIARRKDCVPFLALYPEKGDEKEISFLLILTVKLARLCHLCSKSSENIYFSGKVGYFSKTRRDIFHGKNRPGTGPVYIFFRGFRSSTYKEGDIFRKYPFPTHIGAENIRFMLI
jgi:hypothetical protein